MIRAIRTGGCGDSAVSLRNGRVAYINSDIAKKIMPIEIEWRIGRNETDTRSVMGARFDPV